MTTATTTHPDAEPGSGDTPPSDSDAIKTGKPWHQRAWAKWALRLTLYPAIIIGVLFFLQRRLIYPRHVTQPDATLIETSPGVQRIWLDTDAGRVEALFMPGKGVSESSPGPVVLFAHGNGELIEYNIEEMKGYTRRGVSVFMPEYRGYGRSAGSPSEDALISDFIQAYDKVTQRPDVDADRVVLHGRSIGGGVVLGVSQARDAAAIVLQSPFTTLPEVASHLLPVPQWLVRETYDNRAALRDFDGPVIIFHGKNDTLVPFEMGQELADIAPNARLVPFVSGHNDLPVNSTEYWRQLDQFLHDAHILPGADPH